MGRRSVFAQLPAMQYEAPQDFQKQNIRLLAQELQIKSGLDMIVDISWSNLFSVSGSFAPLTISSATPVRSRRATETVSFSAFVSVLFGSNNPVPFSTSCSISDSVRSTFLLSAVLNTSFNLFEVSGFFGPYLSGSLL